MSERNAPIDDDDLHAYVDRRVTGERRREIGHTLQRDPERATQASDYAALNELLHQHYDRVLNEPIPARLRPRSRSAANAPRFAGLAAALAIGIGIGAFIGTDRQPGAKTSATQNVADDDGADFARTAAIAHVVYMPSVQRPADMNAADEATITRWIAGQLGARLHAPMLAASGFELTGGRMLPGEHGAIVEYMYRNASGERLTVCIAERANEAATARFRLYADGPVSVYYWADGRFSYAVSGGIAAKTLLHVSHDVYAQTTPTS